MDSVQAVRQTGSSSVVQCGNLPQYEEVWPSVVDTVRRPLKEAFLASKIVILDYFSRELPF